MAANCSLLVLCHGFPPYHGGAENAAHYLARAAARTGRFRVSVLTSDVGGRLPAREEMDGVSIFRVSAPKQEWTRHTVPELVAFLRAARRALPARIADVRPERVLAHFTLPAGALAQTIRRRWGIPYDVVLHGSDVPGYQPGRFGALYALTRPWSRSVWKHADRVIAVSEPLRQLALRSWPAGSIAVVPNGVDIDRFRPAEAPAPAAAGRPLRIAVVAQLIERKGLQHLLQALAALDGSRRSRLRLTIHGAGPYEAALQAMVRDLDLVGQVSFAGMTDHDRIPGILRESDLYVLPALQEGLPLSLLEAMASGLPVVATAVGGIPDLVRAGENGLLVPAGDETALRDALARLLAEPELRRRLGAAARQAALAWSWASVWERYEALLASPQPAGPDP